MSVEVEERALRTLAHTVAGVISARVARDSDVSTEGHGPPPLDADAPA